MRVDSKNIQITSIDVNSKDGRVTLSGKLYRGHKPEGYSLTLKFVHHVLLDDFPSFNETIESIKQQIADEIGESYFTGGEE